jgi:hypothetical protein
MSDFLASESIVTSPDPYPRDGSTVWRGSGKSHTVPFKPVPPYPPLGPATRALPHRQAPRKQLIVDFALLTSSESTVLHCRSDMAPTRRPCFAVSGQTTVKASR